MMTCAELTSLVTDYLEGGLPFWRRVRFQLHLGLCHHCRRYLRQLRRTIGALGRIAPEPIPDAMMAELQQRFRSWKRDGS